MVKNLARPLRHSVVGACALLAAWLAMAGVARAAGDQETIARVVDLNREGVAQYQKKHFDAARKALKQALELCESSGLDHHPVAARTHIHLGIVIIAGYGQREIGSRQFNEALQIDPNITLTPGLATPAAQDVFNEALVAVSPKSASPSAASAPVEASASGDGAPPAERADDTRAAAAPRASDEVSNEGPNEGSDGAPRVERQAAPRRRAGDDDDDDGAVGPSLASRVQLGALIGGGVGWASGNGDLNADTPVSSGFAAAKLGHLALQGGYWISDQLMLSLEGRFQMVTGATVVEANSRTYHPATYATAVFAEATWAPTTGHLRPYVSGAIGAGRIRHVVTLATLKDCGPMRNQVCVDTVGAGPLLAGAGVGLMYDLGERVAIVAALNTQLGAPTFTFNVDLNAGLAFRL